MSFNKKRVSILSVLLILDAFVLGGFVNLLIVNRLLDIQLNVYVPRSMVAAGTILNLMDHLLIYFVAYAGTLLILTLITIGVWVWGKTKSQVRYAVPVVITLIIIGGFWLAISARLRSPQIEPQVPTPILEPGLKPLKTS